MCCLLWFYESVTHTHTHTRSGNEWVSLTKISNFSLIKKSSEKNNSSEWDNRRKKWNKESINHEVVELISGTMLEGE